MFIVNEGSADIESRYDGAAPGMSYVTRRTTAFANLHLTRNSGPIVSGERLRSLAQASAIRLTGSVLVSGDPQAIAAEIRINLSFQFVQLFMLMAKRASYAGRTASEGH